MEQRKTFNKQTEVRPSPEGYGLIDAENRKPAYLAPQVSVYYVELETGCMAVASITTTSTTPQVTDWDESTTSTDDISLR
jgi:hypothetical protein